MGTGTGTNVSATLKRKISLWGAKSEAYLSSHVFELLFAILFITTNCLLFFLGAHHQFLRSKETVEAESPKWTDYKWYIAIARGSGSILNLNFGLVVILASRKLFTAARKTPLRHVLPVDKSFPGAHIFTGFVILLGTTLHVIFHSINICKYIEMDPLEWWSFSMTTYTGIALLVVYVAFTVFSQPRFRRKHFRLFQLSHQVGALLCFILLVFHGVHRGSPSTYKWILPGILIYAIDRMVRIAQTKTADLQMSEAHSKLKPGNIIEIRVKKPFNYIAGQYVEIAVPAISREYHPITIASAPHEKEMLFYIKQSGDWTRKLGEIFKKCASGTETEVLNIRLRGPFGSPAQQTGDYDRVVLISGGIGATPFTSICKDLHHRKVAASRSAKQGTDFDEDTEPNFTDRSVPARLNVALEKLYNLNEDGDPLHPALKMESTKYLAKTLSLCPTKSGDGHRANTNEIATKRDESFATVLTLDNEVYPRHFPAVNKLFIRLLGTLHTTRLMFILLLSLVARFSIICVIAILESAELGFRNTLLQPQAYWTIGLDAILGLILTLIMLVTLCLEFSYLGFKFFDRIGRIVDLIVFWPLSCASTARAFMSWVSPQVYGSFTIAHFAIYLPLLFILLSYRLHRSVRAKNLLDTGGPVWKRRRSRTIPEVDFVWTTPSSDSDVWLRENMKPLSWDSNLELHRYVTQEKTLDDEDANTYSHIGRPDWNALFTKVVERANSKSEIGVFFCGPAPMGSAIEKALREVEVLSNLRWAYLSKLSDADVANDFGIKSISDVQSLREYGCHVRLVFREENF